MLVEAELIQHNDSNMDKELLAVLFIVGSAVCVAIAAWVMSQYKQRQTIQKARQWLPVEATIESGALEGTQETSRVVLPTFAFSYKVSDQYYSGRFRLSAHLPRARGEAMIGQMIGRRLLLRYDPERPAAWFIPDESIDGYKVEQKLSSHVIHDYSPNG